MLETSGLEEVASEDYLVGNFFVLEVWRVQDLGCLTVVVVLSSLRVESDS